MATRSTSAQARPSTPPVQAKKKSKKSKEVNRTSQRAGKKKQEERGGGELTKSINKRFIQARQSEDLKEACDYVFGRIKDEDDVITLGSLHRALVQNDIPMTERGLMVRVMGLLVSRCCTTRRSGRRV